MEYAYQWTPTHLASYPLFYDVPELRARDFVMVSCVGRSFYHHNLPTAIVTVANTLLRVIVRYTQPNHGLSRRRNIEHLLPSHQ
jgi:hypothetical protein